MTLVSFHFKIFTHNSFGDLNFSGGRKCSKWGIEVIVEMICGGKVVAYSDSHESSF